jgi:hypothetical protein
VKEATMKTKTWSANELKKIEQADELQVAGRRRDGSLRNPTTIWVVRLGDDLYVRSFLGRESGWYRGAQVRHEGHIEAGGVDRDVDFVAETDPAVNDRVDTAYRSKYRGYDAQYVDPMVAAPARETTTRLVPH